MTSTITLAYGSCLNAADSAVFDRIRSMDPDYFYSSGDLWYDDGSTNHVAHWNTVFAATNFAAMVAGLPNPPVIGWSDHDYGFTPNSGAGPATDIANEAYRVKFPTLSLPSVGIYRTWTQGRIRFILCDERSFKSPNAAQDDVNKTVLGPTQKAWLKGLIATPDGNPNYCPLIVILGDAPWIGAQVGNDDGWKAYHTERDELRIAFEASPAKLIRLSGDMHSLAVGRDQFGLDRVWQAAPFKNTTKVKDGGAGYTATYPRNTDEGPEREMFAVVTFDDTGSQITCTYRGYTSDGTQRLADVLAVAVAVIDEDPTGGGTGGTGVSQQEFDNLKARVDQLESQRVSDSGRIAALEGAVSGLTSRVVNLEGGTEPGGTVPDKTVAAQDIYARIISGNAIADDWTWTGASTNVLQHNDALIVEFRVSNPSPISTTGAEARTWLINYIQSNGGTVPTGGGGGTTPGVTFTPPRNLSGSITEGRVLTLNWEAPLTGTGPFEYEVHEFLKYPDATLKITTTSLSRVSSALQPATLEYAIRAKNAAGQFSRFSNTVQVVVTSSGGSVLAGKPVGWDAGSDPVEPGDPTDEEPGGDPPDDPGGTPGTGVAIPWSRVFKDNTAYPNITGGGSGTAVNASNAAALSSAANGSVVTYTGTAITSSFSISSKSNVTYKAIKLGAGCQLTVGTPVNVRMQIDAPYELDAAAAVVKVNGVYNQFEIFDSMFGSAVEDSSPSVNKSRFIQFGDSGSVGAKFGKVSKTTFRNKNAAGNAVHTVGDTGNSVGGVRYTHITECLFQRTRPFDENDHETCLMGISTLQLTNGQQIIEFCRFEDCASEPEIISMKMNWSTVRGCTFHDCVGSISLRHGDDGEINDNYVYGFEEASGEASYARTSAGPRLYGARHRVHHNTIQVNGNGGSNPSATSLYEAPIAIDYGDVAPGSTSNGHANNVGILVEKNLLVKCLNPIMVVKNYGTAPTGTIKDNWVVECANAGTTGVGTKNSASLSGLTLTNNTVHATTAAAGLTQGTNGEWKAPASADRGSRTQYITTSMVGKGSTWDPWAGPSGGTDPVPGGSKPGDLINLSKWYLTLPNASTDPGDTGPQDVYQPELRNFAHANFMVDAGAVVFKAPVQGETTSGASGSTRSELREMASNYVSGQDPKASWGLLSQEHKLTVTESVDMTGVPDDERGIVGQIHGGSEPLVYLMIDQTTLPGVLKVAKNLSIEATPLLTGLGATTVYSWQIHVTGSRVKVYACLGSDLAALALVRDWPASDFASQNSGCYFKKGIYNKRAIDTGSTGNAYSRTTRCDLDSVTGGGGGGTPTPPGGTVVYPMDLFADYWYITTPETSPFKDSTWNIYKDGGAGQVSGFPAMGPTNPDLDTFVRTASNGTCNPVGGANGTPAAHAKRLFMLNTAKTGVIMTSDYEGSHTPNSTNTRMEFREQTASGLQPAAWSTSSGSHKMVSTLSVDRLDGNHCVVSQIHGGDDDLTVFRVEGSTLWATDGDTAHGNALLTNLQLGQIIRVAFHVQGNNCDYYVQSSNVNIADDPFSIFVPANKKWSLAVSDPSNYFKAGCYLQRKGSPGSWCQVTLYNAVVQHS